MNKIICVGNFRYFYFNDEYTEYIANLTFQIHHLNMKKSFIQKIIIKISGIYVSNNGYPLQMINLF